MWGFELVVMAVMIGVNSVFAAYEIALASVAVGRLQRLVDEGRRGATVALSMKQNMEASLATVQLGITLVGAIAAAVGGAGAEEKLAPVLVDRFGVSEAVADWLAIAVVVVPLTVVSIIVGELIPKVFALRNAEWVCLVLSPPMRWFSLSVWPLVRSFEAVVTGVMSFGERRLGEAGDGKAELAELQDLRATAALARASRLIGQREERIIVGATELRSRPVREVMLPAEHMSTLDANASLTDNLIAAHLDMHTRFPVVERKNDPQSVIGYANVKDIIATLHLNPQDATLRAIVRPIPSLRDDLGVSEALEQLMREHTHIALVRDTAGRVVGLVSLEDILEELVGEIEDEYDRLPGHIIASGRSWVVGGGVLLGRLRAATGLDLSGATPGSDQQSLSDWAFQRLGREVKGGDVLEAPAARIVVRKSRRRKLQEAHITGHTPARA
jgi:putative hemolysin